MFLFGPSEKQIEKLKQQNRISDLIKIVESLYDKTDEKSKVLFKEAAYAAASLLPSNPDSACKQYIEITAKGKDDNSNSKTRFLQSQLLLEALAATKNGRVLEEILENSRLWFFQSRDFTASVERALTGAGEISAAVLINAAKTKSRHDRSYLLRLLGRTGEPAALDYLSECLNAKNDMELDKGLIAVMVEFGKDAVAPLTARLDQADNGFLLDELTGGLLKIGDSSAAKAILRARKKLKDTNEADRKTRKRLQEAAKKLGYRCAEHHWNGCMCEVCGEIRDEQHQLSGSGCTCLVCSKEFHDWDGCLCRNCSADRHEWVSMGGAGIYLGEHCRRCDEKKYWSRDD